jgi:hypothetical protein
MGKSAFDSDYMWPYSIAYLPMIMVLHPAKMRLGRILLAIDQCKEVQWSQPELYTMLSSQIRIHNEQHLALNDTS